MVIRPFMKNRMTGLVLFTIVLAASLLSLRWVFLVPIFQSPDEDKHFDYALYLSEIHTLVRAVSTDTQTISWVVHPYTAHLAGKTDLNNIKHHPERRMPPGYGSRDFYKTIDRSTPPPPPRRSFPRPPYLTGVYPYGYYAALAAWLEIVRPIVRDRPVAIFFGARIFSVLLLACSLLLSYAIARELGVRRLMALLLVAGIGFLPLTSFITSYVQPDNLVWLLVSLCFYLSLLARRTPDSRKVLALLGLALGGLLATKCQFYICVALPIFSMLAVEMYRPHSRWLLQYVYNGLLLLVPSLVLGGAHLWVVWGTTSFYSGSAPYTNFNQFVLGGFTAAIWDFFVVNTHLSFWGIFGWMDTFIQIHDCVWTERVLYVLQVCAWVFLALTLIRLERVASRLIRVARRGRQRLALRMALSNVPLNSYFLFTIFMLALFVYYQNRFSAQGRNWLPYLLPIFLTSAVYAPKALTLRTSCLVCSWAVVLGLLFYCAIGGYYSIKTLKNRYYAANANSMPQSVLEGKAGPQCPSSALRASRTDV